MVGQQTLDLLIGVRLPAPQQLSSTIDYSIFQEYSARRNYMKMKSVSGIVCYVKDINKTAKFYEALGFKFDKREPDHISIRLNWFWIDFHP